MNKRYVKVIEAHAQDIRSGRENGQGGTSYYFVVEWRAATPPDSFFWRGDGGWAKCRIDKVHRRAGETMYMKERAKTMQIGKGDTLMLTTSQGEFATPSSISDKVKNTLFFRTGSSKWLLVPVAKLAEKKTIAAP